jgi:tetratricopeptide (TPR) repeat protein
MITAHHTTAHRTTAQTDFLHWLFLLLAAIALLLALATALAADPMGPPALPAEVKTPAVPLARPFFPENPPLAPHIAAETAQKLWMTFEHQQAGCHGDALAGWERIWLPPETAVWREIGMGAALLAMDDLPQALRRLEVAERIVPHHPVVAYYRGLVWMRQAQRLTEARGDRETGAATIETERAVLELMAIADLEEAIDRADLIDVAERLVVVQPVNGQPMVGPQVRDLLVALGAEHFADEAHRQLFRLHLNRGEFADAERCLAVAVNARVAGTPEMRQLAQAMLVEGETKDALRVMHAVVQLDYPGMDRLCGRIHKWLLPKGPATWLW